MTIFTRVKVSKYDLALMYAPIEVVGFVAGVNIKLPTRAIDTPTGKTVF